MVQEQEPRSTEPAAAGEPLVDLGALSSTRGVVRIDGVTYDLVDVDELGLRDRANLMRLLKRIAALEGAAQEGQATDDDEAEYAQRLNEFASMALPKAEPEVLEKLNVGKKADLAAAFFVDAIGQKSGRLGLLSRIGASFSPGSASTTEGATGT